MKHKHYDVIVAWAEGKEIQYRPRRSDVWNDCNKEDITFHKAFDYRIKPEPKPSVIRAVFVGIGTLSWYPSKNANLILTFDGETGKLKQAEVIE